MERIPEIKKGKAPEDFFYGSYNLKIKNHTINFISTNKVKVNKFFRFFEFLLSNLNNLGITYSLFKSLSKEIKKSKLIISFTDGLSLSLGNIKNQQTKTLGCFHCLSDLENKSKKIFKFWSNKLIKKSLDGLDHIAFFGPLDRDYAIKKYKIRRCKTSIISFGVDTNFWKPGKDTEQDYFFSIGQDPSRDFDTLLKSKMNYKIKIHTDLNIKSQNAKIKITNGNFYKNGLSDLKLRSLYQRSVAVIIPLKDVYQPSGYSVALQAMSCGKTIIISKNKGFWAPNLFKSYHNCIFVKPGNLEQLDKAMEYIYYNVNQRKKIGLNARETVKKYFNTSIAKKSLTQIIEKILFNKNNVI